MKQPTARDALALIVGRDTISLRGRATRTDVQTLGHCVSYLLTQMNMLSGASEEPHTQRTCSEVRDVTRKILNDHLGDEEDGK